MEWRVIVPAFCLIGILYIPGNAAQNNTNATSVAPSVTGTNVTLSVVSGAPNSTITTNASVSGAPNSTSPSIVPAVTGAPNSTIATNASVSGAPNTTSPSIVAAVTGAPNSTVASNASVTGAANSTNANTVTVTTTTISTTTAAAVSNINLKFSIVEPFIQAYNNLSDPTTQSFVNNVTSQLSAVYKKKFSNFVQMIVTGLSNGSVVVQSSLQFNNTVGTAPNTTDVTSTLVSAINSGNLSLAINSSTVTATPAATTSVTSVTGAANSTNASTVSVTTTTVSATTAAAVSKINLKFRILANFIQAYFNLTDPTTVLFVNNVTTQLSAVYRNKFSNFIQMIVTNLSNGSVVVESNLQFNNTVGATPNTTDVANTLVAAINSGNLTIPIDNSTVTATSTATTTTTAANRSPVLASMLTALWMILASLLLSFVMH